MHEARTRMFYDQGNACSRVWYLDHLLVLPYLLIQIRSLVLIVLLCSFLFSVIRKVHHRFILFCLISTYHGEVSACRHSIEMELVLSESVAVNRVQLVQGFTLISATNKWSISWCFSVYIKGLVYSHRRSVSPFARVPSWPWLPFCLNKKWSK